MASGLKMTYLAAALAALLFAAVNAQELAPAEATDMMPVSPAEDLVVSVPGSDAATLVAAAPAPGPEATDMVPVTPAGGLVVSVSGSDVATLAAAAPMCLQCRCCSRSEPSKCEITRCCSTFNCDPNGRCNVVQKQCGCTGC